MKRSQNIFIRLKSRLEKVDPTNWQIIFLVLTLKFFILIFGYFAHLAIKNNNQTGSFWYFGIWNRWDARHYLDIARNGYSTVGDKLNEIAFFPLYPAIVGILNKITGEDILSAFWVSGIASVFLGVLFYQLVKLDYDEDVAVSSVWFLFIFPTSYFLHIPYTESLFLALIIGCFYFARKQNWIIVGILGFLACTARINGLILCFALLFEVWANWKKTRRFDKNWLWLGLIPFGFLVYLVVNYFVTGDFFTFLRVQKANWGKSLNFPWVGIWNQIKLVYGHKETASWFFAFQELLFVGLSFSTIILGWRYLRNSYRVWMVTNWLLFVSTSWLLSIPRYVLTMFPIFILFGIISRNWYAKVILTIWSFLFLSLFIISFVLGRWGF